MGMVGPEFVAGTAALGFLLTAEVLASTGTVCESALVYVARMRHLMISLTMLTVKISLSFALIIAMRSQHWPIDYQDAGPAGAPMVAVTISPPTTAEGSGGKG